jgi:YHS domain-containing protein
MTDNAADKPYTDPVCGMKAAANPDKCVAHAGTTYYFCSQKCVEKFRANPQQYLAPKTEPQKKSEPDNNSASKHAMYTCPMHPEIQQQGPGTCPLCGMALEPMDASAEADNSELQDMTRRFWVCLGLSLPLLIMTMSDMIPNVNLHDRMGMSFFNWFQAALAVPVVVWGGAPFLCEAGLPLKPGI